MGVLDYILIIAIGIGFALALSSILKRRRNGGCTGCSGSCNGCHRKNK